ncbi:MAG: GAF domain-containing sensor histidine kinase [Candidatus Dormibacteraeota bacterium]|nr:GAF domain-containing sensor histidine kinase [Candidatus Dormibacteraeota bacterium]
MIRRWQGRALAACAMLCGLLAVALFLLGLPLVGAARPTYSAFATAVSLTFSLVCFGFGAVVTVRSSDPMAKYAAVMLAMLGGAGPQYTDPLSARPGLFVPARIGTFLLIATLVGFLLIFPSGLVRPRWALWPALALAGATLFVMLSPSVYPPSPNPPDVLGLLMLPGLGGGIAAQFWRWSRISDREARRQTQWVVLGSVAAIAVLILSVTLSGRLPRRLADEVSFTTVNLGLLAIPISIGLAVTRYRLWQVDLFVNRALVYGALSVILIAAYLAVVLGLQAVLEGRGQAVISLIAAGLVAVAFQPLRQSVQRLANRLMYGERDEPLSILLRLGRILDENVTTETLLPRIVETVAAALRIPYVAVALHEDGEAVVAASYGQPIDDLLRLPLTHQTALVGELCLANRGPHDAFSPADLEVLRELAVHVGAAAKSVMLTRELQRSRERLVAARAEERRRLRRDLHDGLSPQLVGVALKLDGIRNRLEEMPQVRKELDELADRTRAAIADVRRLVYALRPPALDELGLIAAIRQAADVNGSGIDICIDAPESLPPLPAAVEVAAYRIAQEAVTNVLRHSGARSCRLKVTLEGGVLRLEVSDDGSGLSPNAPAGVGLISMRERAEELGGRLELETAAGGGTRLAALLPCPEVA